MVKDDGRIDDTVRNEKLREQLEFEKKYDLEGSLKGLIEDDCPGGYDLILEYISTCKKYGFDSTEASEKYDSIVKDFGMLKDWLDIFHRTESGPGEP